MAELDGNGLPPSAAERLARFARSGLRTSLLSVPGAFGVRSVGLEPIGEVMGCIVQQATAAPMSAVGVPSTNYPYNFEYYVGMMRQGYRTSLARMATEASRLGADGVVGVAVSINPLGTGALEFVSLGTGVRANSTRRPRSLFSTDLAGSDVAKLMQAGWAPVKLCVNIGAALAYYDFRTQFQTSLSAGNTEVDSYTRMVISAREDARTRLGQSVRECLADGAIVSTMDLNSWPVGGVAAGAVATIFATAIARFHSGARASASTPAIMPLRERGNEP